MKKFPLQCGLVFVLAVVIDIIAALHIKALVSNAVVLAVVTIILTHYLSFFAHLWFVQYQELARRLWITTASAFGAGLGSAIVIFWF